MIADRSTSWSLFQATGRLYDPLELGLSSDSTCASHSPVGPVTGRRPPAFRPVTQLVRVLLGDV
jgi:hypothetical protein